MEKILSDEKPSKKLLGMLDFLVKMAKDMIEKFGEFDPIGMVLTEEAEVIMLDTTFWQKDGSVKGLSFKQLLRRIEDGIREIRNQTRLDCAIIFYDATLRSQDGSEDPWDALVGRLEERDEGAYQVIIGYEIKDGHFEITSKIFIPKAPHLIPY
jgi:hypothetical protein